MTSKNKSVCSVLGCNNINKPELGNNMYFYRFPQDKDVLLKWVEATSRLDLSAKAESQDADYFYKRRYVICSDHFELKYFKNKEMLNKGLIKDAIPTKNIAIRKSIESVETPMEIDIKVKIEMHICHGCLRGDRRAAPPGAEYLSRILSALIGDIDTSNVHLCWECMAKLKSVHKLQQQFKDAQKMLAQMQYQFDSSYMPLSTLSFAHKDYYDKEIIYEDIPLKNKIPEEPNPIKIEPNTNNNKNDINVFHSNSDDFFNDDDYIEPNDNSILDNINNSNIPDEREKNTVRAKVEKRKTTQINWKREYKNYAKVISREEWNKPLSQYYTKVYLDETEMEDSFLKKERARAGAKLNFKCKGCALAFSRRIDLDRHFNLNHHKPGSPFKCLHCKKTHPSLLSLQTHWKSHSVFYKCNICGSNVFRCSIALHLKHSHTHSYACTNCKLQFPSLVSFFKHYNKKHPFICDYCEKKCALRPALEKHIRHHHIPQACLDCGLSFPSYKRYVKHCRERHPQAINMENRPEMNYCVECDRQFPSRVLYMKHATTKHVVRVPKARSLPCLASECDKRFLKRYDMLSHYNFAHVKVTKFHCQMCDKYFLRSYGLRTHMESVHMKLPKPKDKVCDLCGRAFQTNGMLANHRRTHTGERPFACAHCPAAFAQKGAMKIHQRKQHGVA